MISASPRFAHASTKKARHERFAQAIAKGGRSSSKSWDAAGFAIFLATQCRIRVLCARQFQNGIAESVCTLLKIQIGRFGLTDQFVITENSIRHKLTGSEFMFYGLWRHIDEIKSLEGIDICWIEEAHNLTEEQWNILEPTLRKEGSQFWIIFNPRLVTDFVYRRFISNTPPDTIKKQINYVDNPFLSATIRKAIEAKRKEDEEEFRHIYLGEPLTDDDAVIIKRSWILAAVDAHKKLDIEPTGIKRVGFDVADSGDDKCATEGTRG
jgi:phage terminase large subunit